jgi:GNAT superfamily N-acetyltransferase
MAIWQFNRARNKSESSQREDYLTNQLVAFNQTHSTALPIEHDDPSPLHLYVLDRAGTVLGGLVGRTHAIASWFEISVIWIDERLRQQGLGRHLMEQEEHAAYQRGVPLRTSGYLELSSPCVLSETRVHALRNARKLSTRRNSFLLLEKAWSGAPLIETSSSKVAKGQDHLARFEHSPGFNKLHIFMSHTMLEKLHLCDTPDMQSCRLMGNHQ